MDKWTKLYSFVKKWGKVIGLVLGGTALIAIGAATQNSELTVAGTEMYYSAASTLAWN